MEKINKKNQKLEDAVYISWEESESGWGTRPDGFSLHLTEKDYDAFERDYWGGMPDNVPHEYSRPAGSPTKVKIDGDLYNKIKKTENGVRLYDEKSLVKNNGLVFIAQRSGWVPTNENEN